MPSASTSLPWPRPLEVAQNSRLPAESGLHARIVREGHWLFRHRSVLPFVLIAPLAWSLWNFRPVGGDPALQEAWNWLCVAISLGGYLIRVTTVGYVPQGTSGRNTREQIATTLNTTGWYSVTRNPLYLGNFLVGLGIPLTTHDPLLVLLFVAAFWIYYERIISAEESFLTTQFGATYRHWAQLTPAFLPRCRGWIAPVLPYCWRTVLRREYTTLLLVGLFYFSIDLLETFVVTGRIAPRWSWSLLLVATTIAFVGLRYLKKHTTLLDVAGR
jgi:protein-S-isoprenylcysteine O-methyltransferase Ste14